MGFIDSIIKGFVIMAIYALLSNFTVTDMKIEAAKAHKRGIFSFTALTKALTSK